MAKRKLNEETEFNDFVSPSEESEAPQETAETFARNRKQKFTVACAPCLMTAVYGKYYKFGGGDFISPSGNVYRDISEDQQALEELYNTGPQAGQFVNAPEGYEAVWARFI